MNKENNIYNAAYGCTGKQENVFFCFFYVADKNTIQITGYAKTRDEQKHTGKPDNNAGYINYKCKRGMSHAVSHACKADFKIKERTQP